MHAIGAIPSEDSSNVAGANLIGVPDDCHAKSRRLIWCRGESIGEQFQRGGTLDTTSKEAALVIAEWFLWGYFIMPVTSWLPKHRQQPCP